jgi:hypothetical protein
MQVSAISAVCGSAIERGGERFNVLLEELSVKYETVEKVLLSSSNSNYCPDLNLRNVLKTSWLERKGRCDALLSICNAFSKYHSKK